MTGKKSLSVKMQIKLIEPFCSLTAAFSLLAVALILKTAMVIMDPE